VPSLARVERAELAAAVERETLEATLAAKVGDIETAAADEQGAGSTSVRRATYAGHVIEVRTSYEITVDGEPFAVRLDVDNAGRVHYPGLPTRDFASIVELVARVIDQFPGELGDNDDPGGG
jgi:hypothetical protein